VGAGNETVLYSFTFGVEGQFPTAGLIRDTAGNFYGTTPAGGGNFSYGTIFKLKLNTGGTRGAVSVIHTFRNFFSKEFIQKMQRS
jgi:hypothetical protein